MIIFQPWYGFLDFFFQNFLLFQKCQEIVHKRFYRLLLRLNIIFMQFWTIYDNSKILIFLKIFDQKMNCFSLLRGQYGNFGNFFFKMKFWAKIVQKCLKMVNLSFSRSQTLPLCNLEQYWTKLNFDFLNIFFTKIVHLILECRGLIKKRIL